MTDNATQQFRANLETALDDYHPGWDVRRRATWHPEYDEIWQQNRRFQVWVDTLKRWVRGENFPRVKKFQGFLEKTNFPPELREELLTLFHRARQVRRRLKEEAESTVSPQAQPSLSPNPTESKTGPLILGQPPLSPAQYFIGRDEVQTTLRDWLGQDDVRIITLVGRSGIGKTALACKMLFELEAQNGHDIDAILYLSTPLTGISLDTFFQNLLRILDESTQEHLQNIWVSNLAFSEKITEWVASLEAYTLYILLDNLDDILTETGSFRENTLVDFLQKVIGNTDSIYFVITSQIEPDLPSNLRHLHQILLLGEGLNEAEGVQLLRDLDPNGHCGLRDAPLDLLQSAVERVHGIPRALQILVGILEDDPLARLEDMLSQLEQFEDVHQIITHTLNRLETSTLWVLRALAVLQQPASLELLTFLLEPFALDIHIESELKRLLRMHLVKIDRTNALISIHPIEANAVYQNIAQAGLQTDLELRAAAYYAQFKFQQRDTYEDFLPHLLAFDHYVRGNAHQQAYDLIGEDTGFGILLDLGYGQRVVEMREQIRGNLATPLDELVNNYGYAQALQKIGKLEEAVHTYQQIVHSSNIHSLNAYPLFQKLSLVHLGEIYAQQFSPNNSLASYQQALAVGSLSAQTSIFADHKAHLGLSRIYHQRGNHELALMHTQEALTLAENPNDSISMGNCLELLADIYRNLAQHDQALAHNEEALHIAQEMHDHEAEIYRLSQRGHLALDVGNFSEALQWFNSAMKIAVDHSQLYGQIYCLLDLSEVLLYQGDYQWALNCAKAALDTAERVDNAALVMNSHIYLALGLILLDDDAQAAQQFAQINKPPQPILVLYSQVSAYLGDNPATQQATMQLLASHLPRNYYLALLLNGLTYLETDMPQAQQYFNQALVEIDDVLARVPNLWQAQYAKGLAWAGLAMTTTHNSQITALTHAQDAYQIAFQMSDASGVIAWARKQLDILRPYDTAESLEPLRRILVRD